MPIRSRKARASATGIEPEHVHGPAVAPAETLQDLHGRRLAGAVRAEQAEDLTAPHLEVDAAHGLAAVVRLAQAADGDGSHG